MAGTSRCTRTSPTPATTRTRWASPPSPGRTTTSSSRRSSPRADTRPVAAERSAATGHHFRPPHRDEGSDMLGYVARRLGLAIGTVFAAVLITFLLVHVGEGSPGAVVAGPGATPEEIAAENEALGWNQPLITQFVN